MKLPVSYEIAAMTPLTGLSFIVAFVNEYSTVIVVSLALVGFCAQMYWRWTENRAILRKNREENHGEERRK